jgi:nitrite reductase/ring-hydroxylating ferredoxin subunit
LVCAKNGSSFVRPIDRKQAGTVAEQTGVGLADRLRTQVKAAALEIGADVLSVSRDQYVGRERLEADWKMFRQVPHVIGWAGEVASPGTFLTRDVMGVPVLVTRAKDGVLRAFINGCRHRGSAVAQGCGEALRFVCPYHAWTYGLDGRLIGVPDRPMFDGVDLDSRGLRELPVSDRGGMLTVALTPDVDLEPYLQEVEHLLAGHRFDGRHHHATRRFDLKANWKLAVNVNFEGYHFTVLHRRTVDLVATNHSIYDFFGPHALWIFPFRDLEAQVTPLPEWPFDFQATVVYLLFPSCVLVESPTSTMMLRVYPGAAPGECVLYMESGSMTPILTDADRARCEGTVATTSAILDAEDFPQAEACQRGLEAGVPDVIYGRNEAILQHLAQRWRQASDDALATDHRNSSR